MLLMHKMEEEEFVEVRALGQGQEVFAVVGPLWRFNHRNHAYLTQPLAFPVGLFQGSYRAFDVMLNYSGSDYSTDTAQFGFELDSPDLNIYKDIKFQERKSLGLKNIKGLAKGCSFWIIEGHQKNPFSNCGRFHLRLPQVIISCRF